MYEVRIIDAMRHTLRMRGSGLEAGEHGQRGEGRLKYLSA